MSKKILTLFLVAGMVLSLASCSKKEPTTAQERERQRTIEKLKKTTRKALKKTEFAAEDAAITAQILAKYALDDELRTADIGVKTEKKLVYLTGSAANEAIKIKAEKVAREVKDALGVRNQITVSKEVQEEHSE